MQIEVVHLPGGMTDSARLSLGREIGKIITKESINYPPGQTASDPKGKVSDLLRLMGFERIEFHNVDHDILLIGLWRFWEGRLTDEFFFEFSGTDVLCLTLLCADEPGHQVEL